MQPRATRTAATARKRDRDVRSQLGLASVQAFSPHPCSDQGHSLPSPGPPASLSLFARQTTCGFAWEGGIESLLGRKREHCQTPVLHMAPSDAASVNGAGSEIVKWQAPSHAE